MDENISKTIRDDLIIFKDETLKDIKKTERILQDKFHNVEFSLMEKIDNFEKKFSGITEKIDKISIFMDSLKDAETKISSLLAYKTKSENSIIDLDIKIRSFDKECHDSIYNISNILKNSVLYPGTIGTAAKFKTFHNFIDYVLSHITQAKQFKEKITKEVNDNRIKQDNSIEKLKACYDTIIEQTKTLVDKDIEIFEEKNSNIFKLYDEKFQNIRIEKMKFDMSIKDIQKLLEDLNTQVKETDNKNNSLLDKYNDLSQNNNQNNNEINSLKEKYISLSNSIKLLNKTRNGDIKDLDFTRIRNINNDNLNYNDMTNDNNVDLSNIKIKKNASRLKEYIKGKININQLQALNSIINFKSAENLRISKNNDDEEKKIKFSEKSESIYGFPTFRESNKEIIKNNITDSLNYNTINQNKDSSLRNYTPSINKTSDKTMCSDKRFKKLKQLSISLNLDNNGVFNLERRDSYNKNYKGIMQSVKNIIQKGNNNNIKNYGDGYPRIVTNQGERIIVSSRPVFHRHKFTKNLNRNLFYLNKKNQKFICKSKDNNLVNSDKNKDN